MPLLWRSPGQVSQRGAGLPNAAALKRCPCDEAPSACRTCSLPTPETRPVQTVLSPSCADRCRPAAVRGQATIPLRVRAMRGSPTNPLGHPLCEQTPQVLSLDVRSRQMAGAEVARANPPATSNGGGHAERSAVRRDNDCICCREHGRVRQTGRNQEALSRRSRWNNRRARDDRPSVAPLSWQRARSHGRSGAGIRAIAFLKFGEVPLVRTGCPTGVGDRHSDGVRSAVCPLPLCNGCDQFGAVPR